MPKLNFIHICDYASMSQGNKVNILGIFKNISGMTFPITHPQLFVVSNFSVNEPGEYKQVLKLVDDIDKDVIPPLEFPSNVSSLGKNKAADVGMIASLVGLKFPKPGTYDFVLKVNGSEIARTQLTLTQGS